TVIFFLGVPLIGFIIWVIRRLLRTRSRSNYLGWTFAGLWTLGWVCAILFAASLSRDFSNYVHTDTPVIINQPAHGKMIVAVSQPVLEYTGHFWWIDNESDGWDLSSDTLRLSTVRFDVQASIDSSYHVVLKKYSYGKTEEDALSRAENIQYNISSKDSILDLGNGYSISQDKKFRLQQVEVAIQVPVGKKIKFDESVKEKLNPVNFKIRKRYYRRKLISIEVNDDRYFRYKTGVEYTMGADGILKDGEGMPAAQPNNDYRYPKNDSLDLEKTIEQKKQELKDLEEKKAKQQSKPNVILKKKTDTEDGIVARRSSPDFTLVQFF
ncbi:MAG TPA: hypothetical protein VIV35_12055, partial [Chitinophagaceae bacterium]